MATTGFFFFFFFLFLVVNVFVWGGTVSLLLEVDATGGGGGILTLLLDDGFGILTLLLDDGGGIFCVGAGLGMCWGAGGTGGVRVPTTAAAWADPSATQGANLGFLVWRLLLCGSC